MGNAQIYTFFFGWGFPEWSPGDEVLPDLADEGITRVEVGEERLHFITSNKPGLLG